MFNLLRKQITFNIFFCGSSSVTILSTGSGLQHSNLLHFNNINKKVIVAFLNGHPTDARLPSTPPLQIITK